MQTRVTNPAYKGDYHYSRRRSDPLAGKRPRGKVRLGKAPKDAVYVVPSHHEALIPAEGFDDAQRILAVNRWTSTGGSMGRGEALLQRAVYCEVHRRMMSTLYKNRRQDGRWSREYKCIGDLHEGRKQHTGVPGIPLEAAVERELFGRISPPSVERLKKAWEEAREAEASDAYRAKLEVRRRQAEVHDLEYRYLKSDPDNTRVRSMLEDKLEEAKRGLEKLEKTGRTAPSATRLLDERGFEELLAFAADFRAIFYAQQPSTKGCSAPPWSSHTLKLLRPILARAEIAERLLRTPLVVPSGPSPHGALHEAREAVLPDAILFQAAEEALHDPVLPWV